MTRPKRWYLEKDEEKNIVIQKSQWPAVKKTKCSVTTLEDFSGS